MHESKLGHYFQFRIFLDGAFPPLWSLRLFSFLLPRQPWKSESLPSLIIPLQPSQETSSLESWIFWCTGRHVTFQIHISLKISLLMLTVWFTGSWHNLGRDGEICFRTWTPFLRTLQKEQVLWVLALLPASSVILYKFLNTDVIILIYKTTGEIITPTSV